MFPALAAFGVAVFVSLGVRISSWGLRRGLKHRWTAWLTMIAPLMWTVGILASCLQSERVMASLEKLPPDQRTDTMAEGIANALEFSLYGAGAGILTLAACFAFFASQKSRVQSATDVADATRK